MTLSRKTMALIAAVAVSVPGVAIAQRGPGNLPTPAKAYGVICERPPYETSRDNVEFSRCVRNLARGVNGNITAHRAAVKACRQANPDLSDAEFGKCVRETKTLVRGLKALKAR